MQFNTCTYVTMGVSIHWTGLLDWNTGLDYWTGILDWNTGLDYWTELFSFFGQVCVYFSANLETFFKKLLLYSCHTLRRVIGMILITDLELPYCSTYLQQFY